MLIVTFQSQDICEAKCPSYANRHMYVCCIVKFKAIVLWYYGLKLKIKMNGYDVILYCIWNIRHVRFNDLTPFSLC